MVLAAAILFASAPAGYAQVPTPQDIAACNAEAQQTVGKGMPSQDSAQPTTKDHARAAAARRSEGSSSGAAGNTQSDDPQLAGMNAEGAKDPSYQAAYRTCMRKAGF
jgi:hypothetical protein